MLPVAMAIFSPPDTARLEWETVEGCTEGLRATDDERLVVCCWEAAKRELGTSEGDGSGVYSGQSSHRIEWLTNRLWMFERL